MKAGQEAPLQVTTTIHHQEVPYPHPTMTTTNGAPAVAATRGPRGQAAAEGPPGRQSEVPGIVAAGMSQPENPGIIDINQKLLINIASWKGEASDRFIKPIAYLTNIIHYHGSFQEDKFYTPKNEGRFHVRFFQVACLKTQLLLIY